MNTPKMDIREAVPAGMDGFRSLQFHEVDFAYFKVHVTTAGKGNSDYVLHFYRPTVHLLKQETDRMLSEQKPLDVFFEQVFPQLLSDFSQSFFSATFPQLKAKYTPENKSWWFRANGCANVTFPEERIQSFLTKLNEYVAPYFPFQEAPVGDHANRE